MEPAAAYELYRKKVFAQPPLAADEGALFAAMRAEDKKANLRLIMGASQWLMERLDRVPNIARAAHNLDPLTLLTEANAVFSKSLRAYKGASIEEFKGIVMAALEVRLKELFGHGV